MLPHQERVVEEKSELDEKATKLSEFIGNNPVFETLDIAEQMRLREQCEIMWEYSEILDQRIKAASLPNGQSDKESIPVKFAADGLIQLHWQNKSCTTQTEMFAQGGPFEAAEAMQAWIEETYSSHSAYCPEGWTVMVCDSTSEFFWWPAK